MKKQWCLFCEREFPPRLSPTRPHDPSGEHNSKKMTHHTADHPKPPKRQDRPSDPQHHSWKDPSRPGRGASRDRLFKAELQEARACAAATKRQNRQPRHQEAAHDTPNDGRRRAHGGPEPAPTEHDARAIPQQSHCTADAVPPQVVRLPDHRRQFERRLRVQLVEGRGPETGSSETAAAAALEALELARLVPLDHQRR